MDVILTGADNEQWKVVKSHEDAAVDTLDLTAVLLVGERIADGVAEFVPPLPPEVYCTLDDGLNENDFVGMDCEYRYIGGPLVCMVPLLTQIGELIGPYLVESGTEVIPRALEPYNDPARQYLKEFQKPETTD